MWSVAALALAGVAGLYLTRAIPEDAADLAGLTGNVQNGAQVFIASGCASCHARDDAEGQDKLVLSGGQAFPSDFGTFVAPNISMDEEQGIGDWTLAQFASAVRAGVSPDGTHYYPAFPYASYRLMTDQDIVDLWAYMQTLPADDTPSAAHDIGFPFNIRRSLGVWKALYANEGWVMTEVASPELERGRYLVEVLAHCGECHTSRDALGGMDRSAWLAGAPNPTGRGRIPTLVPPEFDWVAVDIVYYLETGFTPEFDSAGGHMVDVIENFAQLPASDREAVAAYLRALPAP